MRKAWQGCGTTNCIVEAATGCKGGFYFLLNLQSATVLIRSLEHSQHSYTVVLHPSIVSYHITSHHITSHHITSHYIKSHHITSHHITSHHITSHHTTSHHITSHHITSHHITSHHITSHHITSHHIELDGPERAPTTGTSQYRALLPGTVLSG